MINSKTALKTDNYKLKCSGRLKNGMSLETTLEIFFDEPTELNSEKYKSAEKEIRDIMNSILINY